MNTLNFNTEFNPNDISNFNDYATIITNIHSPFDMISMNLFDKVNDKQCKGILEIINPLTLPNDNYATNTVSWKIWQRETLIQTPSANGFSIPADVVFRKQ